jgi:hypothetical protein
MISRTKNTMEMCTKMKRFDKEMRVLVSTVKHAPFSEKELRTILDELNSVPLCVNTRGFTASTNQLAMIRRNIRAIDSVNALIKKIPAWSDEQALTNSIFNRYRILTENLNKQLGYYKRGK